MMNAQFARGTVALATVLVLAGCGGGATPSPSAPAASQPASEEPASAEPTTAASQTAVELVLAHSYQDAQPQHACGAQVIEDEAEAADVGLTIEIFGASELGGDADRIASVVAGDIDIDIQGASALSALYAPMSVVDGAFVFDDADHLARFFADEASEPLKDGLRGHDRRQDPWCLVGRCPPVHREQGDPDARGPGGPADALPAVPAVPDEREGHGSRGR